MRTKEDFIDMKPAIVRYTGDAENDQGKFTKGAEYEAYTVEYWEGTRDALVAKDDEGMITTFNSADNFLVVSDPDNVLNDFEATVRCISNGFDEVFEMKYGSEYIATGMDQDGYYLVKDETGCSYYYSAGCFEIVKDPHGILNKQSLILGYER